MADNQSKFGAVISWAGGIAATVIASVLIYYFTKPAPTPPPAPAPISASTPPAQIGLNGFVEDDVTQKPVADAIVTADLGSKLASQPTDNEGRYAFIMDSTTPLAQSINVDVLAGGYQHYTATVPLTGGDTFAGIQLQPNLPAAVSVAPGEHAAPGASAAPVKAAPKPIILHTIPKNYRIRSDTAALKPK